MPVSPQALSNLVIQKVNANIRGLSGYQPLGMKNPQYFIRFMTAIATGIAQGNATMPFTTKDSGMMGAPPIPGVGAGVGVDVDKDFLSKCMYTQIRARIIKRFGTTRHEAYPPKRDNSGVYLKAITDGIAEAVKEHYKASYILVSTHPMIYLGQGKAENFKVVNHMSIKSIILSLVPEFKGIFLPDFAEGIAVGFKEGIEGIKPNNLPYTTAQVTITGVCVPSQSQTCNISPSNGTGAGIAQ